MPFYKKTRTPTFHDPIVKNFLAVTKMVVHTEDSVEYVDADTNGDRIVKAGTVLFVRAAATGVRESFPLKAGVYVAGTNPVSGVLIEDLNLKEGAQPASVLIDGWVDERFAISEGVFGTVEDDVKTAARDQGELNIRFTKVIAEPETRGI